MYQRRQGKPAQRATECRRGRERLCQNRKYHPRKWVDCSSPTYKRSVDGSTNATHGSAWIVHIQPSIMLSHSNIGFWLHLNNPRTSVRGIPEMARHSL